MLRSPQAPAYIIPLALAGPSCAPCACVHRLHGAELGLPALGLLPEGRGAARGAPGGSALGASVCGGVGVLLVQALALLVDGVHVLENVLQRVVRDCISVVGVCLSEHRGGGGKILGCHSRMPMHSSGHSVGFCCVPFSFQQKWYASVLPGAV